MLVRIALLLLAMTTNAVASELRVSVTDAQNRPVADAVITVTVASPTSAPIQFDWPMRIAQHNMQFEPFVLVAPAGARVSFPNLDEVRHQVFSLSSPGPFELRLYGRDESHAIQFRNVGVIALGCNIHDQMSAYIYVVNTPYAAKTNAQGIALIQGLPQGQASLTVWHPYLRGREPSLTRAIAVPAGAFTQAFQVRLRPPPTFTHAY